ncbi:CehA/McbA family metallohydrolase [Chloroflexota bacterium]
MHTSYSDGYGNHREIAQAAIKAGVDAVIVTDHNVLVNGVQNFYEEKERRVLLMVGEEIHDQTRDPQKNHLLVFGIKRELSTLAPDIQGMIDVVRRENGLSFIAHPKDPAAPAVNEEDLSWVDWQVNGYTGIELWNAMSEFKSLLKTKLHAFFYAYNPEKIARGPFKETIKKWEELLSNGQRIVVVGGTDAHALPARLGPLKKTIFPYEFHFRTINNHLLLNNPLTGDLETDQRSIIDTLRRGCSFIGYDLPASTKGFRFNAKGIDHTATMGDEISAKRGITFQIYLPQKTECNLIKDGKVIKTWMKRKSCTYITPDPGNYRVEAYINYQGHRRAWIFSNPIYVSP